jgi:2-methylcitrate dehydratase PrpD
LPLIEREPETGLEAKFSIEYCVATALLHGAPGLSAFTDEATTRPDVVALARRVEAIEAGPALAYPIEGWARIVVMAGGGRYETEVETPRGDPKNPLTWDELAGKFRDCASVVLNDEHVEMAIALIGRLDELADVGELIATVASRARRRA